MAPRCLSFPHRGGVRGDPRLYFLPLAVLRIVAGEVAYVALPIKYKQVVYNLVHEVAVVTHYDNTAGKVAQILLKHLKGENVEIIGRLVKNEEVGVAHEHGTQVESATFASAQLIHITMLLLWWEKEML